MKFKVPDFGYFLFLPEAGFPGEHVFADFQVLQL
jgi:hypothetical protein